jgi:hypothetical protein
LAEDGVSKPENCKFPKAVKSIELIELTEITEITEIIEVLEVPEDAGKSIDSVKVWKQ